MTIQPILVFDQNLTFIASLDNYQYLRWDRYWRKPGEWEFIINRYKNHVNTLMIGNWIAIEYKGKYRIGQIQRMEIQLDENGKASENIKFNGFDGSGDFYSRLCLHNVQTGSGYDVQSTNAESAMYHYVDVNTINPTDANRKLEFLELGTNLSQGVNVNISARFQTITDILESISLISDLGYETLFDINNKKLIFQVNMGTDRSISQGVNNPVIFSPDYDNVEILNFSDNIRELRNLAVIAGEGEGPAREVSFVYKLATGEPIGRNRKELFVDARDLKTIQEYLDRGKEALAEFEEQLVLEIQVSQLGPFTYIDDYNLGDIVTAIYPNFAQMDARIIEVVEEWTIEKGMIINLVLGREYKDIIRILKFIQKNNSAEMRT